MESNRKDLTNQNITGTKDQRVLLKDLDLKKYMAVPSHLITQDKEKTPNEFGFQKLCFPLTFFDTKNLKLNFSTEEPKIDFDELIRRCEDGERLDSKIEKEDDETAPDKTLQDQVEKLVKQVRDVGEKTIDSKLNSYETWQGGYNRTSTGGGSYTEHTSIYNKFMNSYLYSNDNSVAIQNNSMPGDNKEVKQGGEVMDYRERKEYAKKVMMNARYGNKTLPHSSETDKLKYELWKASSKFNQLLSFVMYDSIQMIQ